eukprot:TRINITY_DN56406_c0_g1_i1.p1 TRINITY_DN56406_c0_g1~~TRINITY_DN56406_c0_g1_i1.p1  ORF type:complete len:687 (+),score=121.56 TRINITY_DN56406_c0_g1_i1:33-2093(+)
MSFSGGVKLGDLDDFLALSEECVKPLIEAASGGAKAAAKLNNVEDNDRPLVAEIPQVQVQRPNLIKGKQSKEDPTATIGQVTLSDCLACSGCVTSAETVLLQIQSGEEFLRRAAISPLTVVTLSAEARASLAAHLDMAPLPMLQRVAEVLRRLGATYVLDSSASEAISLLECKAEFVRRYRATQQQQSSKCATAAVANGAHSGRVNGHAVASSAALPLLTSHCPGWTCYAEKVVDPAVLPHLAPLRPPQHVQGRLVKTCLLHEHNRRRWFHWWRSCSPLVGVPGVLWEPHFAVLRRHRSDINDGSITDVRSAVEGDAVAATQAAADAAAGAALGSGSATLDREPAVRRQPTPISARDVYHVSVQPCFDRKIEASRPLFELDGAVREVDTVLSTTELLDLICTAAGEAVPEVPSGATAAEVLAAVPPAPLNGGVLTDLLLGDLRADGRPQPLLRSVADYGGSGGFLEHVFREAAVDLFGAEIQLSGPLKFKTKQNEDMREVLLEDPTTHRVLLRFVAAYGFRNIQNVVQRLAKSRAVGGQATTELTCGHFIEILACPGGCLNGGGQIPVGTVPSPTQDSVVGSDAVAPKHSSAGSRRERLRPLEAALRGHDDVGNSETAIVAPCEHPGILKLYRHIAARGDSNASNDEPLDQLVGGEAVRRWLAADWRSLKVDVEGKPIVGASALKW